MFEGIVDGNLLEADERYVCHQCNCVTRAARHLAETVFNRFPYANVYKDRQPRSDPLPGAMPGDIIVRGDGLGQRFVIAMLAQYYPGKPKFPDGQRDGFAARQSYFKQCLGKISAVPDLTSVAFPFGIGCGAAGGNWPEYLAMIEEFAANTGARVSVYRLKNLLEVSTNIG